MVSNTSRIEATGVFFVNIADPNNPEKNEYAISPTENPLASGLVCNPNKKPNASSWGTCAWRDILNNNMRMVELRTAPSVDAEKKLYQVTTVENITYRFRFINKEIYATVIETLKIPQWSRPTEEPTSDEAVQSFFSSGA